jgi:hypothetical protein
MLVLKMKIKTQKRKFDNEMKKAANVGEMRNAHKIIVESKPIHKV